MTRLQTNVRSAKLTLSHLATRSALAMSPKWTVKAVSKRFFTPLKFNNSPRHLELLAQGEGFTHTYQGQKLSGWRWGTGEKVLLLHGWAGRGAQFSRLIQGLVAAGYQAITFDQPAHGEGRGRSNVFEFIEAADGVKQEFGPFAAVVGHSMGCIPALKLANEQGLKAVLYAPGMTIKDPIIKMAKGLGLYSGVVRHIFDRLEHTHNKQLAAFDPKTQLESLTTPVLILHDKADKYTSAADSAAVSQGLAHITYHQTQNLGHSKILEDPETVAKALAFLQDVVVS